MFLRPKLVNAVLVMTVFLLAEVPAPAASCKGPEAMERRLAAHPDAQTYTELGDWFQQKGQSPCAVDSYRAALKIDPHFRPAIDRMAKSLIASGDYSAAINLLHSAPRDEELTLDLATAFGKAGMADEASETLVRAVKANPSSATLTSALVGLLASNNHLDDAYRLAEHFYQAHPHDVEAEKLYLRVLVATNLGAGSIGGIGDASPTNILYMGGGTLTFNGVDYRLTVGGISVGATIGISETQLIGTATGLNSAADISGLYSAVGAGLAIAGGERAAQLVNGNGVVLELSGHQVGFEFSLDLSGMSISLA